MLVAIIQARVGSSRLPNKIFMDFSGKPNLLRVYERVALSTFLDKIVIATTTTEADSRVLNFCNDNQLTCFRGSETDVLDRYYQCAESMNLTPQDTVVRITADCPVIDPDVIDRAIEIFKSGQYDYVSNTLNPTYPDGLDVEVFSFEALKKAWENADKASEREHVTPYIYHHPELFRLHNFESEKCLSHYRLTLDEKADYDLIQRIYEGLYEEGKIFKIQAIDEFLMQNPHLCEINDYIRRNEGYKASVTND